MPEVTLTDISLKGVQLTERVSELRKNYFRAVPEICTERPRLITWFSRGNGLFDKEQISILDKANTYRYVLAHREPIIRYNSACEKVGRNKKKLKRFKLPGKHVSLFAGSTTSKFKGVPLYPEFLATTLWPELRTISRRTRNPYYITEEEIRELNYEIFPRWMKHNVLELARKKCFLENLKKLSLIHI